jgi:hypothetical protein
MNKPITNEEIIRAEKIANEAFLKETDKPTLERLAHVLRHRELWPKYFEWKFSDCDHCAMGLARQMFPDHVASTDCPTMSESFDIPMRDAQNIFMMPNAGYCFMSVTPEVIADRIDAYLSKRNNDT